MVFNFRRRKNKNASSSQETVEQKNSFSKKNSSNNSRRVTRKKASNDTASTNNNSGKRNRRAARQKPLEFSTPLGTIQEGKDEVEGHLSTGGTSKTEYSPEKTSPEMPQIHVLNAGNGEAEIEVGDLPAVLPSQPLNSNIEVKKQLFIDEHKEEEEPFDALQAIRREDPHILEVMKSETINEEERGEKEDNKFRRFMDELDDVKVVTQSKRDKVEAFDPYIKHRQGTESQVDSLTKNIIRAFNCNEGTSLFDGVCADTSSSKNASRVFYNDVFAFRFVQETMIEGIPMLYHHPPTNPIDNDWTGQSMNMFICPGDCIGKKVSQPRLEWRTLDGGWSRLSGATRTTTVPVSLMDIHSIIDKVEDGEEAEEGNDFCFFSITTNSGDVHLLECSDEQERDRVVTGIRNILSRLANSIITGDDTVTKELYAPSHREEAGDLPLRTNAQSLKAASHDFLDTLGSSMGDK